MKRRTTTLAQQLAAQIGADPAGALAHIQRARSEIESRHAEQMELGAMVETPVEDITKELEKLVPQGAPISDAAYRKHRFKSAIVPDLILSGFDGRYHIDDLFSKASPGDARQAGQATAAAKVRAVLRGTGAVLAMTGPRGTGKTSIAAQIVIERLWEDDEAARDPLRRGCPCRRFGYHKMTAIVAKLKAHYGDFGSIEPDRLEAHLARLISADLLIIDEIHEVTDDSRHKDRILTDIIDRRYSSRRDTLLITNQTTEAFYQTTNPSIISRLEEHGGCIKCEWGSFRE